MSALEQSMKDIIAANSLIHFAVNITYYDHREENGFEAMGQWLDDSKPHGRGIAVGTGDTIAEAMAAFTLNLAEKRLPTLPDEPLPAANVWRELSDKAIGTVESAVRETNWGQPTFGPDAGEELRAEYDALITKAGAA